MEEELFRGWDLDLAYTHACMHASKLRVCLF